jgi:hypothetical protein
VPLDQSTIAPESTTTVVCRWAKGEREAGYPESAGHTLWLATAAVSPKAPAALRTETKARSEPHKRPPDHPLRHIAIGKARFSHTNQIAGIGTQRRPSFNFNLSASTLRPESQRERGSPLLMNRERRCAAREGRDALPRICRRLRAPPTCSFIPSLNNYVRKTS